jgi:hypothetical protein
MLRVMLSLLAATIFTRPRKRPADNQQTERISVDPPSVKQKCGPVDIALDRKIKGI